ncbi:MAG: hypothetical protein Q4B81_00205 [Moraxella sp.]|nr:hypothetical protein [Moraxella sp.]
MNNNYHNQVRRLIDLAKKRGQSGELIAHQIGRDEVHDPTLVAMRIYGSRHDCDVVMIACGTSAIWQPLPQKVVHLPTPTQLLVLKRRYKKGGGHAV